MAGKRLKTHTETRIRLWSILFLGLIVAIGILANRINPTRIMEGAAAQLVTTRNAADRQSPFVLIAVDGNFTALHGCPPYSGNTAKKIGSQLNDLGIKSMVIHATTISNST